MKKIIILAAFFVAVSYAYPSAYAEDKVGLMLQSGDTESEVIERWGEPDKINRSYKEGERRAVWIYNCEYQTPCAQDCDWYYYVPCYYLFFQDGELVGWHDVR